MTASRLQAAPFQHHSTEEVPQNLSEKERVDVFVDQEDHDIHYKTLSWQVRPSLDRPSGCVHVNSSLSTPVCRRTHDC